jgi:ferric-dicitrate binding protein FerR (iron transport regulator)
VIERPESSRPESEEEQTGLLLRLAGARAEVRPSRHAHVRRAFLAEARAVARTRVLRRRALIATGILGAAAAIVFAVRSSAPQSDALPEAPVVARIARIEGREGHDVRAGDWMETGDGRAAIQLIGGASVRLDRRSRVRFVSDAVLELGHGALYVDSGPDDPKLEIRSDLGTVQDVGTQFEVRRDVSTLRVRVRSGVVEVRRAAGITAGRPGTEMTVDARGVVSRPFLPYGPDWAWVAAIAPPFDGEGRTLDEFVRHLCREQGWTLSYSDSRLARDAAGMILRGSTKGLEPLDALEAVLAATELTHRLHDGELQIARQSVR